MVWKIRDWNNLKGILHAGKRGSRIIITTRDDRVALAMRTFLPIHYLTPLQSDECWSLLAKHAFGASNYQRQSSNLEVIGKKIAMKCDGLPLAAIALGGLLRTKSSQDDWNNVLKSDIWDLANDEVQPALLLSYHYLPTPLKRCFAYCSIFPKSSKFEKEMVVQLWTAEGLVNRSKSQKSWEKVGEEYFDELVSRSLIHRHFVDGGEASFEMHDLINDLATMVSSTYCMRLDEQNSHQSLERPRHLSYNRGNYDSYNKFDTLHGLKSLRTFLALPLQEKWPPYYLSNKVVDDLLPAMKQLRVLSLSHDYSIIELPNSIGNLIYLRYLNLSHTKIKRLPSETCKLYNLQTLLLSGCIDLIELPENMGKLVNLHHLNIRGTALREMPVQIATLRNLQTLSDFVVSKQRDGLKVAELGKFPHLQGKISISELQNVVDPSDASQANLKTKEQIEKLELQWDPRGTTSQISQIQSLVLEQLWPSTNLKNLTIKGYGGTIFPNWLGDCSFGNIVTLHIRDCGHCSLLPPLGQLRNLKELYIESMGSIKSVGAEFYGCSYPSFQPFPTLKTLSFWDMPEWEEWNLIGGTAAEFPSLRCLSLKSCRKLKGNIPNNLPSLIELLLMDCDLLVESGHSDDNSNIVRPSDVFSQLMLSPLNSLLKLKIEMFPSLTSFPRDGLPKTLQSLYLGNCKNLEFLSHESLHNYTSLEELTIFYSCESMTSFTLGSLPILKSLSISGCENLKWILFADDASQSLSFLRSIDVEDCHELESFYQGGLPIPDLIRLGVCGCEKLQSLPEPINTFPGLQELLIYKLPNLQCFAKEGLPINLRLLIVGNVGGGIAEWGLESLACLWALGIAGDDMVEALMKTEEALLPASLVSLYISNLDDIECLDGKWLHHLTSLQHLLISKAPKLKLLPDEGLPSSLSILRIKECPLLEASLRRKRGKEWRKIAHIPFIFINDKIIT